ncbi:MAG: hypothetical protein ACW986_02590 [Promethearchaeota archaeon]|jgi:hypothetical protein
MDWKNIIDAILLWYDEFVDWYLIQPIYGQVLTIIGVIAIIALAITLVYYVIKGVAYLIYYILKGIYYFLKGIGLGFYKLCEAFYYLVSGEQKPIKQSQGDIVKSNENSIKMFNDSLYCSECGRKFSDKMTRQMLTNGIIFCVNCGKQFKINDFQKPLSISH